ncbi:MULTISPECIES: radical SAM protein [Clostridium]|uniref:Biotin synthase n=1 Tax=Clostridium ragsdalei P11 TaxID=1353534 RepID=A0A1A6B3V1_9CLOT|nr:MULTISPECIES: radical SAM protein [Clostridium]OBR96977.1 biotin synthase [Clostridium ragsdalei P11]QXE17603.1 radical SAM protein [Clostridium sp. 001]
MTIDRILNDAKSGKLLNKEEAISLLNVKNNSSDFYKIISLANEMTRSEFNNKAFIFAQIGLNAEPCPVNCKFCSMGKNHYTMESTWRKDMGSILSETKTIVNEGINDLFLMTTADYPINDFLNISKNVRNILPKNVRLVANIGDFDYDTALKLKEVGFTGAYHIKRLREGIDTTIKPEARIETLDSIKKAGLELYYCVEPIGPEHSYEEIVDEMLRARDYNVGVMAAMRRIPVKGTPLYEKGQISSVELSKIAAVTRIVTRPHRAMNAHETIQMSLICGVNQLYAEAGANPRDSISNTEKSRGLSVKNIKKLFEDAEYEISRDY